MVVLLSPSDVPLQIYPEGSMSKFLSAAEEGNFVAMRGPKVHSPLRAPSSIQATSAAQILRLSAVPWKTDENHHWVLLGSEVNVSIPDLVDIILGKGLTGKLLWE